MNQIFLLSITVLNSPYKVGLNLIIYLLLYTCFYLDFGMALCMNTAKTSMPEETKDEIIRTLQEEVKNITSEKELLRRQISNTINESRDTHFALLKQVENLHQNLERLHEEEIQLPSIKRERNFNQAEDLEHEHPNLKRSRREDYYIDLLTFSKRNLQQQLTIVEEKIDSLETHLLNKNEELRQMQEYSCELKKAKQEEYLLFENKLLEKNAKIEELNSLVNAQTTTITRLKYSNLNIQETLVRDLIKEKQKNLVLMQHLEFLQSRPAMVEKSTQMPEFPLGAQLRNPFLPPRK